MPVPTPGVHDDEASAATPTLVPHTVTGAAALTSEPSAAAPSVAAGVQDESASPRAPTELPHTVIGALTLAS